MKMIALKKSYFGLHLSFHVVSTWRFTYLSTEHPEVTYFNKKYVSYFNLTSQRFSRTDPIYYVGIHAYLIYPMHNNVSVHFIFYEFLTNRYKRSFVEMCFKFCDLIHKDSFFGAPMRQGKLAQGCPFLAGEYHLYNMSVALKQIPPNFPFTKGRILANVTATATQELLGYGHIDMEIKEYIGPNRKKESKDSKL